MNSHKQDEYKRKIAELRVNTHSLLGAMNLLRDDLLSRGEIDHDGTIVVNCGASAWRVFCNAINETPTQSLQSLRQEIKDEILSSAEMQQIKRDAVLEIASNIRTFETVYNDEICVALRLSDLESRANNLVKGGE